MLGCRWIGLQVRTSRRHTGPTACPGICRQHPSPRHQFSRECGSVKKYFQEVDRSRPSVLMLEFLDFQVNVCPGVPWSSRTNQSNRSHWTYDGLLFPYRIGEELPTIHQARNGPGQPVMEFLVKSLPPDASARKVRGY